MFIGMSREHPGCILQGAGGAVAGAGSTLGGRIAHSAMCIDHAADRAAVAAKRSVRAKAGQLMHATDSSACWLRKNMKVAIGNKSHADCLARDSAAVLPCVKSRQCSLCLTNIFLLRCL